MKQTYTQPNVLIIYPEETDILTLSAITGTYGGETAKWGSDIFY